jgi:DNA-binding CsgD family transcriptional regulator
MVSQSHAYKSRQISGVPARAIVVTSPHGSVQFATDRAAAWLKAGFGLAGALKRVPHSVVRWLTENASAAQAKPFVVSDAGMRLRIDLLHTEANSCCLLLEKSAGRRPTAPPHGRPLTRREAEVLAWVARGKSNAEIAAILHVCTKTVDKHLERIYPKLGVENRTAAASHASSAAIG